MIENCIFLNFLFANLYLLSGKQVKLKRAKDYILILGTVMEPVLNEEPVLNDSLDDFIALSQAANLDIGQNLEDSDLEEDGGDLGQDNQDSFDDLMSQVDDNDYMRMGQPSAKLKVNNWLSKVEKPSNEQNVQIRNANQNNFEVRKFQMVRNPEDSGATQNRRNSEAQQRQDYIFTLLSREQDLEQQRIDMYRRKHNRQ